MTSPLEVLVIRPHLSFLNFSIPNTDWLLHSPITLTSHLQLLPIQLQVVLIYT